MVITLLGMPFAANLTLLIGAPNTHMIMLYPFALFIVAALIAADRFTALPASRGKVFPGV